MFENLNVDVWSIVSVVLGVVATFFGAYLLKAKSKLGELVALVREAYEVSDALHAALEDNKVWHVKRVRLVNGEPLCFEDDYCNYDLTGDIPLEVSSTSLFNHFENDLNLHIAFSDQQIDAVLAGEELGKYLQVDPVTPLLRVLSITSVFRLRNISLSTDNKPVLSLPLLQVRSDSKPIREFR